ncbi:MAG: holo-ACP synthase [SAR202 cluster bacterium]|jgi:holo-[acyl-carrier protein] synthase|nr:holo-ACP synthase [SAR202 cluster bacterium]
MLVNGIDMVEISRIRSVSERYGERFLRRIYTEGEAIYCRGRAPQLAARFAAKEAVMKALGTGIRGVKWRDIEVVRQTGGPPMIVLHGTALARAKRLEIDHLAVSLTHSQDYAMAFVVGESIGGNNAG